MGLKPAGRRCVRACRGDTPCFIAGVAWRSLFTALSRAPPTNAAGYVFGGDVVTKFNHTNNVNFICRAHQHRHHHHHHHHIIHHHHHLTTATIIITITIRITIIAVATTTTTGITIATSKRERKKGGSKTPGAQVTIK